MEHRKILSSVKTGRISIEDARAAARSAEAAGQRGRSTLRLLFTPAMADPFEARTQHGRGKLAKRYSAKSATKAAKKSSAKAVTRSAKKATKRVAKKAAGIHR